MTSDRSADFRPAVARLATAADADEVVRLACVMFMAMGASDPGDAWRASAARHFGSRVTVDAIGAVVDHPEIPGRLISSGASTVSRRLPTTMDPIGVFAYIQWVATDDAFRRSGCARAVMTTLLASLHDRGVSAIELHATPMGEPLYRALGFWEGTGSPALRKRSWDPPPG